MGKENVMSMRQVVDFSERLSEHFTLGELCRSDTADRLGVPNVPLPRQLPTLRHLCREVLERVRSHVGLPLLITSGYRCEYVNERVRGVHNSQHTRGEAADFVVAGHDQPGGPRLRDVWLWMREHVDYDQLILEQGRWIHVSCRLDMRLNRRQAFQV